MIADTCTVLLVGCNEEAEFVVAHPVTGNTILETAHRFWRRPITTLQLIQANQVITADMVLSVDNLADTFFLFDLAQLGTSENHQPLSFWCRRFDGPFLKVLCPPQATVRMLRLILNRDSRFALGPRIKQVRLQGKALDLAATLQEVGLSNQSELTGC